MLKRPAKVDQESAAFLEPVQRNALDLDIKCFMYGQQSTENLLDHLEVVVYLASIFGVSEDKRKVKVKATTKVKVKATTKVKVKATTKVKVKATTKVEVKATTKVKVKATTKVKVPYMRSR